jgi:hypothetical protein
MNLQGRTVSIWAYIDTSLPDSCSGNNLAITVSDGNTMPNVVSRSNPPIGTWFQVTGTIGTIPSQTAREVDVALNLCDTTANVNVYLDDFSIN